jgi:glycosyltransferase involved in cell wall biosynthesis
MMKVAYICEPQIGGTYTSFQQVRERLLPRGIDYRCIPPVDKQAFAATPFELDEGVDFIDYPDGDPAAMAGRLVRHLQEGGFAAMVILPGCYPFVSSLPPYLPREIRCLARMPHNARGVYWPTALLADHLNRIIAVGPRLKSDLVSTYGVADVQVEVIGNGVDIERFFPADKVSPCRAVFVGRIEDVQKNVFMLPKILARTLQQEGEAHLTVVGSGPDSDRLRHRICTLGLDGNFDLVGRVDPTAMPLILRTHGVFILPSRFEGCSNSTLEAMASGCVPLLSRLPGISDHVVEHGAAGFLAAPGDWKQMGDDWARLIRSRDLWSELRAAARKRMVSRFSLDRMADEYARLFKAVDAMPDVRPAPTPLSEFILHPGLASTWRRWVPSGVKKWLRTWAAQRGISP